MASPLPSELYATSQGDKCTGDQRCYYCGAPCSRSFIHGQPGPATGSRAVVWVAVPASPYFCRGCWLFGRRRITVTGLGGEFKDGQQPRDCSWLIREESALVVGSSKEDLQALTNFLLSPPLKFCLALRDKRENRLQDMRVNDLCEMSGETPLHFTLDGAPLVYTTFELRQALEAGEADGKQPGVRVLWEMVKKHYVPVKKEAPLLPRGRGRPPQDHSASKDVAAMKKVLRRSGG